MSHVGNTLGLKQLRLFADTHLRSQDVDILKDSVLARLSEVANTAQFVSYAPDLEARHSLVRGHRPNFRFKDLREAATVLLDAAPEHRVNVRSFDPKSSKGLEFIYGLDGADDVVSAVQRLAATGAFTIINETIDVDDGGVSGVAHGDIIEFAPGATPRCVEEPGITTLNRKLGVNLLNAVYGFTPELDFDPQVRIEFSIHPIRRGYKNSHTIIWEMEDVPVPPGGEHFPQWPNRFSRFCGDKAFGLLVAFLADLNVPATLVIPRHLAPFRFGRRTATGETWIRTCPSQQVPGKYTTRRGWIDPFELLAREDSKGESLASVLCQAGVDAKFSGALSTLDSGEPYIEGVAGSGERFMQGEISPLSSLPSTVSVSVRETFRHLYRLMGPVRMEWAFDGEHVWVLQLHRLAHGESSWMIYPGQADVFLRFEVSRGLAELRALVESIKENEGITLVGKVGRTSHMCDLLRQAHIPSSQDSC